MKRPRRYVLGRLGLSLLFGATVLAMAGPARAAGSAGSLRMFAAAHEITAYRYGNRSVFIDPGVYIAAVDNAFDLRVGRRDYGDPLSVSRAIHNADGSITLQPLPSDILRSWSGLDRFFHVNVRADDGTLYLSKDMVFCPNSYQPQRVSDGGPDVPSFPYGCQSNPLSFGMVWGIDQDWAVDGLANFYGRGGVRVDGPDGHYKVTVTMTKRYVDLFHIDPAESTVSVGVTVVTSTTGCPPNCAAQPGPQTSNPAQPLDVPILDNPDPSILPDVNALPSWGISTYSRKGRDILAFGATIWVGGNSLLDIEGFRDPDSNTMQAWQYFYQDGQAVGKAPAGTMVFDTRRGHNHWHLDQFAAYRLLDDTRANVVRSHKQSFCIFPTDAVNLLLQAAQWRGDFYGGGLSSACGDETSLWIREELPVGWGDTYFQYVAGQAFDITNVPNGAYYIAVVANPLKVLHETNTANDISFRKVYLRGEPGARKVIVPLYQGIDTEHYCYYCG